MTLEKFPSDAKIDFAYGKDVYSVRTITRTWGEFCARCQKHMAFKSKADSLASPNFIGGPTDNKDKKFDNLQNRTLVTIDYDALPDGTTLDDIAFAIDMTGYAAVAYTTFRHGQDDSVRVRVVVPIERPIDKRAYPKAARQLVDEIGIGDADACSFSAAQMMFFPSCMEGYEDKAWSQRFEGSAFPYVEYDDVSDMQDDDGLLMDIIYEPLDFTEEEVDTALSMYPAELLEYDQWLEVGLGLWHQYRGDNYGFDKWLKWSEKSPKHDPKLMGRKWASGGGRTRPITFATIMSRVGGVASVRDKLAEQSSDDVTDDFDDLSDSDDPSDNLPAVSTKLERLIEIASKVEDLASYEQIVSMVSRVPDTHLRKDQREMIAGAIHGAWNDNGALSKSAIKSALTPPKRKRPVATGDENTVDRRAVSVDDCYRDDLPWWLRGWIYDEKDAEFVHVTTAHSIKREAFRMKYDRMPECVNAETDAVTMASIITPIPTVAGKMYWPGMDRVFRMGELSYLNTWSETGVPPSDIGDFTYGDDSIEAQAVEVFNQHMENTIADDRERRLVLDWMSYVYSNPGSRVRWALLLYGIEGNGKSYFHNIMSLLMGTDASVVAASSIEERFTGWAEGKRLIGIEEIRVSGMNKYKTLDRLKPFISNDQIEVERKGKDGRTVPNFGSYMMFTNHADAIPVGDGDRRYFIVSTRHTCRADLYAQHGGEAGVSDYFQKLFTISKEGVAGIGRYLLDHEYSEEFDPNGRAPDSIGKEAMRQMHISEEDDAIDDALEKFKGPYVNDTIIDVTHLQDECEFDDEIELPKRNILAHIIAGKGYTKYGRVKARGKNRTLWYRASHITPDDAIKALRGGGITDNNDFDDVPF